VERSVAAAQQAYADGLEKVRLPNLKASSTSISLRLPNTLPERIKVAARKRDVPYQSLIKVWLAEKLDTTGPQR